MVNIFYSKLKKWLLWDIYERSSCNGGDVQRDSRLIVLGSIANIVFGLNEMGHHKWLLNFCPDIIPYAKMSVCIFGLKIIVLSMRPWLNQGLVAFP